MEGSTRARRANRVQKAAPKSRRRRRGEEPVAVTADFLASLPLFATLEPELRERLAPRMTHLDLPRGERLFEGPPADDKDSPVFLLLSGDVAVRRGEGGQPPRVANFVAAGEAYVQKLFVVEGTTALEVEAMVPVRALQMPYRDMNYAMRKSPAFRDAFGERLRPITERQKARFDDELQGDIARFIVAQRLTFAGRVKLKRMDICIECDGCYDACRTRHGTDRLGASEVKYGLTEIPQNCHNCAVPECLDKCKFGHLSRHPDTGEIVISDNCVGCTMCAQGCSFGAIRMHSVADLDIHKYFPNRDPEHKGQNMAQKCDNCSGYADQACITACPAGAMFQVDGAELFNYWEQFNVHKQPGFADVLSPEAAGRFSKRFWVVFSLLQIALLTWEVFGRLWWPAATFTTLFHGWGWLAMGVDPDKPLSGGGTFGHTIGYIGAGCMIGTQGYRLGKLFAPRFGSVQAWMDSHIWLGVLGGVYGFYHTAFIWREPIAVVTFALMMVAIVTGTVGRYLLYLVPRSAAGQQLALEEIQARIQALNQSIESKFKDRRVGFTVMTRVAQLDELANLPPPEVDDEGMARTRLLPSMVDLLKKDRAEMGAIDAMATELKAEVQEGKAEEVLALLKEKARLERSTKRHALLSVILKRYRVVHVVSSNIMFGALALHIVRSLMYLVG
ncbi:MAG: hypothetical protein KC613_12780 [Myxococcales bacterium]|nr:hypothetical protein [Myxococcales bacterium]